MSIAHMAYLSIVVISWIWALSQIKYALKEPRYWPPPWGLTASIWLVADSVFFTYLGYLTLDDIPQHPWIVGFLSCVHIGAFIQWVRLPRNGDRDTPIEDAKDRGVLV